jgi:hypothetical protein
MQAKLRFDRSQNVVLTECDDPSLNGRIMAHHSTHDSPWGWQVATTLKEMNIRRATINKPAIEIPPHTPTLS